MSASSDRDVLIVVPNSPYTPAKGWTAVARAPLEGAVIASAVVQKAKYRPRCVDLRGLPREEEDRRIERLLALAAHKNTLAVCIAGTPGSYDRTRALADALRRRSKVHVLVGGALATISYRVLVDDMKSVDYWLVGECEKTLGRFLKRLEDAKRAKSNVFDISDLNVVTGAQKAPARPPCFSLNDEVLLRLPYHLWLEGYDDLSAGRQLDDREPPYPKVICYSSQRGCNHSCHFCANKAIWGSTKPYWRTRDSENVATDLEQLRKKDVEFIYLNDPTFNEDFGHAASVADAFGRSRLPWACMIRALTKKQMGDVGSIEELFDALHKNGCRTVFLGVESASEKLLREYKSGVEFSTIRTYIECANRRGKEVEVEAFFVAGLPNEDESTVKATRLFVRRNRHRIIPRVKYFVPFPGSQLLEQSGLDEIQMLKDMSNMEFDGSDPIVDFPSRKCVDVKKPMKEFMRDANSKAAFSKDTELVAETRAEWLSHTETGLLFPDADCTTGLGDKLRIHLAEAFGNADGRLKVRVKDIGRIIVHGYKPDLLWSRSEAYRPVDFFFGRLDHKCEKCIKARLAHDLADVASGTHEDVGQHKRLARYVSPFWHRTLEDIRDEFNDKGKRGESRKPGFPIPQCWREGHPDKPNIGNVCPTANSRSGVFRCYTAREVLALSRMRLSRWALKKTEFLRTPATSLDFAPAIKLFNHANLTAANRESSGTLPNLTVAAACSEDARNAEVGQSVLGSYLDDHVGAFATDDWLQASVWKDWVPGASDETLGTESHEVERARDAWKQHAKDLVPSSKRGDDTEEKEKRKKAAGDLFALDAECALFLPKDERVLQAVYNLEHREAVLTIYFELRHDGLSELVDSRGTKEEHRAGRTYKVMLMSEKLPTFCRSHLIPWQSSFREADDRWENHETLAALYPGLSASLLLGRQGPVHTQVKKVEAELADTHYSGFAHKLKKAELFYRKRVLDEEDTPVGLALASMREIWREVYDGALEPHYTEFQRFQQLLQTTRYRDHLTHSFQVYLVGSGMLDIILSPEDAKENSRNKVAVTAFGRMMPGLAQRLKEMLGSDDVRLVVKLAERVFKANAKIQVAPRNWYEFETALTRYQWAMTSLMHDFACPAEKANDILGHLFRTFVGPPRAGEKSGSDGLKAALSTKRSGYEALIHRLIASTRLGGRGDPTASSLVDSPLLAGFTYEALTDDHGFLSSVYLFNQLFDRDKTEARKWWRLLPGVESGIVRALFGRSPAHPKDEKGREVVSKHVLRPSHVIEDEPIEPEEHDVLSRLAEGLILEVLDAIMKHNIFKKEYDTFVGQGPGPAYLFPDPFFSTRGSVFGGPLAGLLMLCDTICDWGRIVHPDELRRHEKGGYGTSAALLHEVDRPECYVSSVSAPKKGRILVKVDYEWRLPYSTKDRERDGVGCLMKAYDELRMEMIPYAPGFAPWGGCRLCARQETGNEDCEAWRLVRRFWGLLGRDGQGIDGKLRFSDPHASRRGKPKGVSVAVHIRFPSQCPKDIDKDKDKDIIELGPYVR